MTLGELMNVVGFKVKDEDVKNVKLADAFTNWAEQNSVAQTPESVIAYRFSEGLLNVPKCRLLISEREEAT